MYKDRMYAADISDGRSEYSQWKLLKKYLWKGLPASTISPFPTGTVYVSDSKTSRIWKIDDDKPGFVSGEYYRSQRTEVR
jgi:hypothetical protein